MNLHFQTNNTFSSNISTAVLTFTPHVQASSVQLQVLDSLTEDLCVVLSIHGYPANGNSDIVNLYLSIAINGCHSKG